MSGNRESARHFTAQLTAMADDIEGRLDVIFAESIQTAAEAVVIGNGFGPGVPVDTGFLRASFRFGLGAPVDGPSLPPEGTGQVFTAGLDTSPLVRVRLEQSVYLTTVAEYAQYLEDGTYDGGTFNRRTSEEQLKNQKGTLGPTPFIEPVLARWQAIVDDAVRRTGGSDGTGSRANRSVPVRVTGA